MKLSPESVGVLAGRACRRSLWNVADAVEAEIGREISDAEYNELSALLKDAIADALGKLELT